MKLLALICTLATLHLCNCARNELIATADCVCPGRNFTYECSVVGGSFTVWRGTAISPGCEVTLFHSMFSGVPGTTRGVCNNGDIVGYNIGVEDGCYTSKLDILVSPGLNGRTVECILDDVLTNVLINESTLSITTTPFPPPTNLRLVRAAPGELTFSWSPPQQTCPSLAYNVISNDCGACRNNSAFSNTTCRGFTLPSTCTLTVQSIICGNLTSTESSPITARLNVPEAPTVMEVYPYYSESDRRLLRLTVNFSTVPPFQIADRIDGSATSYTLTYSDATTSSICGLATISASSCTDEICAHSFDASSSLCPSAASINVTVFAANVLGNGLPSTPSFQDGVNSFVDVNFNSEMKAIICIFLNQTKDSVKECFINITYGPNCGQRFGSYVSEGTGETLSSPELPLIDDISEYCFTVTARSSNVTVSVVGTLNLIEIRDVSGNDATVILAVVVPAVAVLVGVVGTVITVLLLMCYFQFGRSLVVIKFSNPDSPGSLAQMLKVFKDYGINIISINTYWTEADVKWNLCGSRQQKEIHDIVYISCTNDEKRELLGLPEIKLDFIEDDIQEDTDSPTAGSTKRARTVKVFVEDKPGVLWKVLNEFGIRGIKILGLNTRSNYDSTTGYKDNYVSCSCSTRMQRKIVRALEGAGALKVEVEHNIKPSTRILQFYVKDKPGALANALKAFRKLNINTTGINPAYMKLETHNVPGHETIYVECQCGEDERDRLFEKLRQSTSDAIKLQLHDNHQVISRKQREHQNYCIVKFSIRDKVGSLVSALEVFQELEINILGVNSFDADPGIELRPKISIEYKHVQMVISSGSNLKVPELISELQSSGHIIDVECNTSMSSDPPTQGQVNYDIKFLARHQVGTLVKALSIFIDHNINIISLSQESVSRDVRYVQNHIRFEATNQQEVTLISELYATGLVMEVETLASDEHHVVAKIKESQNPHGTMKGETLGNAFEREPPMGDTQV